MEATVGTALMRDDIATQVVKFAVPTKKGRRSQSSEGVELVLPESWDLAR